MNKFWIGSLVAFAFASGWFLGYVRGWYDGIAYRARVAREAREEAAREVRPPRGTSGVIEHPGRACSCVLPDRIWPRQDCRRCRGTGRVS